MDFHLTFNMDNAAFGETEDERAVEIARILKEIGKEVETETITRGHKIYDVNGNLIGAWEIIA